MPSSKHEGLFEVIRNRPMVVGDLLVGALGVNLPFYQRVALGAADLGDVRPTDFRADAVVHFAADDEDVLAVVVEVQLRPDPDKRWTWPLYLVRLRARLHCPTMLLVMCADDQTAESCATPIELGHPGLVLRPLVVGPSRVPVVTDHVHAIAAPELSMLSAMAHGATTQGPEVLSAFVSALAAVDGERATLYSDIVWDALPEAARRHLEELLASRTYEYQSDFVRRYVFQGRAEGEVDGEVRALLAVLSARRIDVPAEAQTRISTCTDTDTLTAWIGRAATADRIEDVLD
jgi:hypothetical protein